MRALALAARDLLFPPAANCVGCRSRLGADTGWFCADCARRLRPFGGGGLVCPVCGRRMEKKRKRCAFCGKWPPNLLTACRCVYSYAGPARGAVRALKYGGNRAVAEWMAQQMSNLYLSGVFGAADVIAAVPMHPRRLRERGFNHAQVLAEAIARHTGLECRNLLARTRNTRQQARLAAEDRQNNLVGAFRARRRVDGARVLLIDDVLTTGETALHCATALREAGAAAVFALTFAGAGGHRASGGT